MQHKTTSTLDRQALMETFLKGVSTEELLNHDINSWYAQKALEQADEMRDVIDSPADGLLKFLSNGPMSGMAAMLFAQEFSGSKAVNFYEMTYRAPGIGLFCVNIQRTDGETPAKQLADAKDRIAELEQAAAEPGDLDGRMRAAGMQSAADVVAGQPIDAFVKHKGVVDFPSLMAWVESRRTEFLRMQARYHLGDKEEDDLYEWIVSHVGVFAELHVNLRFVAKQVASLGESHSQVIQARDLYKQSWQLSSLQSMSRSFRDAVKAARKVWLDENDPKDGTDCVTPFDQFLYTEVVSGEADDLPDLFELMEWAKYPADGRDLNSVAKGKMSRLILAATGLADASLTVSDR